MKKPNLIPGRKSTVNLAYSPELPADYFMDTEDKSPLKIGDIVKPKTETVYALGDLKKDVPKIVGIKSLIVSQVEGKIYASQKIRLEDTLGEYLACQFKKVKDDN